MAFAAVVAAVVVPTVAQAEPPATPPGLSNAAVCAPVPGVARCHAKMETVAKTGAPYATISYASGYGPADLHSAYSLAPLPATGATFAGNGQTVAIVDAYDNPNTAADLVAYRQQFNLPLCATSATTPTATDLTSCFFTKVNQAGAAGPLPAGNTSWGQEIDLDIEMVSATCPACKILLVEANSASFADLGAAVDTAAKSANAISNSYGGNEFSGEAGTAYDGHYNHPGIAITVSSGDNGYGTQFPAASEFVTAVGGTHLTKSSAGRGWSETAWSGAGSGCSAYIARPSWQTVKVGTCTKRVVADVSAVADPATGVAVYDSYGSTGGANWYVFGGTSVASPIIASVYALAANAGIPFTIGSPYTNTGQLWDVTSGSNGRCTTKRDASNAALCTAGTGYDGPTGLGSPHGTGAF